MQPRQHERLGLAMGDATSRRELGLCKPDVLGEFGALNEGFVRILLISFDLYKLRYSIRCATKDIAPPAR